ncbi:hypothetical protein L3Q82_015258, partial [Scortum barcoo]
AVTTKLRWDEDKDRINFNYIFLTQVLPDRLKEYMMFGKSSLLRTDLPSVSLLQKSPSSPVSCHATGFYPDRATLIWRKDGEELHEDVDHGEILPNHDGSFQISVDLKLSSVTPEDWSRYDCVFHLSGVKDDIVTKLDKAEIRTNWGLLILICIAGLFLWRRNNDGFQPANTEGKEDTLAAPPGDVADHEVPPATLPHFEPFSPESRGSSVDVKLKIRLARLQLEAQEKERKADHELKLQEDAKGKKMAYIYDDGLLMRRWISDVAQDVDCNLSVMFPSQTSVITHDIVLTNPRPIKQHAYRVTPSKREVMKRKVEYLVQNGFAVPSSSPWSSPCLLDTKSDGSPRFCTDFRKVNAVTVPDAYPLPLIDDCIDEIGPAKYISKLDMLKGYWQVPLTSHASDISAFVTPDHFLQYTVMPFGMCNAPATFQRLVNKVLGGVENCKAYLDIVVYSDDWISDVTTLRGFHTPVKCILNPQPCQ